MNKEERATLREIKLWTALTDKRKQELFYVSNRNAFLIITQECASKEIDAVKEAVINIAKSRYYLKEVCNLTKKDGKLGYFSIEQNGNEFVARADTKKEVD